RVPDLDGLVVAAGGESRAVGAEAYAVNGTGVVVERQELLAGGGVPEPHGPVAAGRGNQAAVGAERRPGDGAGMSPQGQGLLPGDHLQDRVLAWGVDLPARRDQAGVVGAERHLLNRVIQAPEMMKDPAGRQVPDEHFARLAEVASPRGQS